LSKMDEAWDSEHGITSLPVVIKLFTKDGYDLSLIDMPGLTKIAL
jgi:hypothetical protein